MCVLALLASSACTVTAPAASSTGGSPGGTGEPANEPLGGVPAELAGTWIDSWSASMQYGLAAGAYDFDTGVWFGGQPDLWDMAPNRGLGIAFGQDGSFLWVQSADGGMGGCQSYSVRVIKGTAAVDADVIRFHPTAQRERYESTCDPSLDYDRDVANEDFALPYEIGATEDVGRPTLKLRDESSGTTFLFFRQ